MLKNPFKKKEAPATMTLPAGALNMLLENPQLMQGISSHMLGQPKDEPAVEEPAVPYMEATSQEIFSALRATDERLKLFDKTETEVLAQLNLLRSDRADTERVRLAFLAAAEVVDPEAAKAYKGEDLSTLDELVIPDWPVMIAELAHIGDPLTGAAAEACEKDPSLKKLFDDTRQAIETDLVEEKAEGVPFDILKKSFLYPLGDFWAKRFEELTTPVKPKSRSRKASA